MGDTFSSQAIEHLFPETNDIRDNQLSAGDIDIWIEVTRDMAWDNIHGVPKNTGDQMLRSLVEHVRGVMRIASQLTDTASEVQGLERDRDLLIAACLLHDVSKALETEPDPDNQSQDTRPGRTSTVGKNIQHGVFEAHNILEKGLLLELADLVITHTHASDVRGKIWNAALLFYAHFADSHVGSIRAEKKDVLRALASLIAGRIATQNFWRNSYLHDRSGTL